MFEIILPKFDDNEAIYYVESEGFAAQQTFYYKIFLGGVIGDDRHQYYIEQELELAPNADVQITLVDSLEQNQTAWVQVLLS